MKKYRVEYTTKVTVMVEVMADNIDDAEEIAEQIEIDDFSGNGGYNKLIGVEDTENYTASISVNSDLEFESSSEIEE